MTTERKQGNGPNEPGFKRAWDAGYHVHQGTPEDGELDRLFWWTLMREGWTEPEVSNGEWATRGDAERAAVAALEQELSSGEDIPTAFARPITIAR